MTALEIMYAEVPAPPGAVVGVIEVIDEQLVTVAETILRSQRGVLLDIAPGRYLAQGRLASGEWVRTSFEVTAAPGQRAVLRGRPNADEPEASMVDGWACAWRYIGRRWLPTRPDLVDPHTVVLPIRASVLQVGGGDVASLCVVAPVGLPLVLRGPGPSGTWGCSLGPGIEASLLQYLHAGDVAAARTVARAARETVHAPGDSHNAMLDTAIGYHLLSTGQDEAGPWLEGLLWTQPDSVDVAVLNACHLMRQRQGRSAAREELIRASSGGLPVVARGLSLLLAGLRSIGEPVHAQRLDRYLSWHVEGPLTAFTGRTPDEPGPGPWNDPRPPEAVRLGRRAAPTAPATPARAARGLLSEALDILQARGLGTTRQYEAITVGDLSVEATVIDSATEGLFDFEMRGRPLTGPRRALLTGTTLSVQTGPTTHWLATFDQADTCRLRGLPPANWVATIRDRPAQRRLTARSIPLPRPVDNLVLAAATNEDATEVMRAITPSGTLLVLTRQPAGRYLLEVSRPSGEDGVLAVEYGLGRGESALRLLPFPVGGTNRSSAVVRLDGIDIRRPWHIAENLAARFVAECTVEDLTASVRAAASAGTRRAWRSLAADLPSAYRQQVLSQLAEYHPDESH